MGEDKTYTHQTEGDPAQAAPDDATAVAAPVFTRPDSGLRPRDTSLPERIARYETISKLGEGSFGLVLKSHDPNLDRAVAVKIQKFSALASRQTVDRFLREARAAAQLRHPNIVPVFEYGQFADNHFIVYQFIEGKTLKEWTVENKPTIAQKALMTAKIADALDYAHVSGIVHRDIKPANILVDDHGEPHIADFGCAKREQADVTHTVEGSLMGTPAYMSPEAAAGQSHTADGRTDIWSLGVMFYEMLAGERPFRGKLTEIFHAIQNATVRSLRQFDSTIPVEFETICQKCLEKDPERRFQTGRELADDLRRWMQGLPILSRRTSVVRRTWMWAKRNPAVASLLTAVAVILLLASIVSTWFSYQLKSKQDDLLASQLVSLESASPASLKLIIDNLATLNASSKLNDLLATEKNRDKRARYQLAAYQAQRTAGRQDLKGIDEVAKFLPHAEPDELLAMVNVIKQDPAARGRVVTRLWESAKAEQSGERLRAGAALAQTDPESSNWSDPKYSGQVIGDLLSESSQQHRRELTDIFKPVRQSLEKGLLAIFNSQAQKTSRDRAADILSRLFADKFDVLCQLGFYAEPFQLKSLFDGLDPRDEPSARQHLIKERENLDESTNAEDRFRKETNIQLMLAILDSDEALTTELDYQTDPTLRTALIHSAASADVDQRRFRDILDVAIGELDTPNRPQPKQVSDHRLIAAIASLGEYGHHQINQNQRLDIKNQLLHLFQNHPHSGVHSMCRWLLHEWGFGDDLRQVLVNGDVQSDLPKPGFSWHEDPNGFCFALFGPDVTFQMGKPENRGEELENAIDRTETIPYRFGISTCEVQVGVFLDWEEWSIGEWIKMVEAASEGDPTPRPTEEMIMSRSRHRDARKIDQLDQPITSVSWDEATLFCHSFDRTASDDDDQTNVYKIVFGKRFEFSMVENSDSLDQPGHYRLPTATEWEYACRAGTTTRYFFGRQSQWMNHYGWNINNSNKQLHPVARLKPNDFGMFDMHGNATEWCHNRFVAKQGMREIRDQHYNEAPQDMRVYGRQDKGAWEAYASLGFRIARTYPPPSR